MEETRKYGYIKSEPDDRDVLVKFTENHVKAFAMLRKVRTDNPVFDLRTIVTIPQALCEINQLHLGACTSQAIAFAYAFDEIKQTNKEVFMPSRLFIYYNERMIEGTVNRDSGAKIRDGIKSINKYGVCMEHHWIYDISKFTEKPPQSAYDEAKLAKSVKYAKIDLSGDKTTEDRVSHLKRALQSGFPFVFGFEVFQSFESPEVEKTGMVPMPKPGEKLLGGHAVCAVGFDDTKQCFIGKNSWGAQWGLNSYFYIPYQYVADPKMADEFWVIQQVTDPDNIPGFSPKDINPEFKNDKSWGSYCSII